MTPDAGQGAHLAAVALLARRDFAAGELAARLQERGYPAEAVAAVIADLTATRMLDDSRFTTHYVAYHAARGQGPRRIARDLADRGVAPLLVETAWLQALTGPRWRARCGSGGSGSRLPESWPEKAKAGAVFAVSGLFIGSYPLGPGPRF